MAHELYGRIFDIQRFCTGDGPGIRTTVFFQGCPLHCEWCHNPESRVFQPRVSFKPSSCISCGRCKIMQPGISCRRTPGIHCSGCGICIEECPGCALTLLGRSISVEDVMRTVLRDLEYYRESDGGLTLSGGEPLCQSDFAHALLLAAKNAGIRTAVETSGAVPRAALEKVVARCDLFLFDIKTVPERYRTLTGADPELIFSNLHFLSDSGCRIILRVPLVNGKNVEDKLLAFLKKLSCMQGVKCIDILPYHDMGRGKASMAGLPEADWQTMSPPSEILQARWSEQLNLS